MVDWKKEVKLSDIFKRTQEQAGAEQASAPLSEQAESTAPVFTPRPAPPPIPAAPPPAEAATIEIPTQAVPAPPSAPPAPNPLPSAPADVPPPAPGVNPPVPAAALAELAGAG